MRSSAIALLALASRPLHAKVIDGVVKLSSQDTEQYVAKFSFSPYVNSKINGSFHTDQREYFDNHPHSLMLCLYDDKAWPKFQTAMLKGSLCRERQQMASWSTKIVPQFVHTPGSAPRHDFTFSANLKAKASRAHYWFAMLMDCYLEEYDAHPPPMKYDLLMLNGDSQLPADEDGMWGINAFALCALAAYGAVYFYQLYERWTRLKQGHLITLIFLAAYAMQACSVLCELCHLSRFARDGKGLRWRHTWFALDFVSAVAQATSELTISFVLIALAFGWTLGLQSQEPIEGALGRLLAGLQRPGQLLRGLRSPSLVLLALLAVANVMLHAFGRRFEEDFNNFHDFEHWPGLVLLGLRLALCALFVWALHRSLRLEKQREVTTAPPPHARTHARTHAPTHGRAHPPCQRPSRLFTLARSLSLSLARAQVLSFLSRLRLLGCVWFLCFPCLVAVAMVLPPYRRHQVVAGGAIVLQSAALAMLSTLFMTSSEYYKISSLAHLGSVFESGFGGGRTNKIAID